MVTVEELRKCKKADAELIQAVKNRINEICSDYDERNHIEDGFGFENRGVCYDVKEGEESEWTDEGKYQYQDITYQLVSYDKNIEDYPNEESIIDRFDLFIILSVTRSGSYFTDYYYTYDKPTIQTATLVHIPEKIIPAHDEVRFVKKM